jgi:CheY-like chemotaxis protein
MTDKPRCRILVVEDEATIAMLVEEMVLDFGSEVVGSAAKMEEALRLASDASLDAAILDVNVGGAVVYPVADLLRGRGVPMIIFATGYGGASFHRVSEKTPRCRSRLAMKSLPGLFARFLPISPATPKQRKAALLLRGEHHPPRERMRAGSCSVRVFKRTR